MKKYMELPADYAVLSDDEMTYTTGGSAVGGIVTIVGVAVLASSYVWGIAFTGCCSKSSSAKDTHKEVRKLHFHTKIQYTTKNR